MLSWDEKLMIGLKVLERLRPNLRSADSNFRSPFERPRVSAAQAIDVDAEDLGIIEDTTTLSSLPSLEEVLQVSGKLSPYSLVLGLCEDGLPFLLDLTNPAPGALLVAADKASGKTRLLKSILTSAIYLNSPDEVSFYLISDFPYQYVKLAESDHCHGLLSARQDSLNEMIEELAQMVEDRRRQSVEQPAIVLVIDDLHACLQAIDTATFERLYWLVRHGPRSRIWTFAAYSTQRAEKIDERFLAAFRTRLVGSISDRRSALNLSGDRRLDTRSLDKGIEFCVPYGEEWIHFWVCDPQPQIGESDSEESAPEEDEEDGFSNL